MISPNIGKKKSDFTKEYTLQEKALTPTINDPGFTGGFGADAVQILRA